MIININNLGGGSGSGSSYTLPVASASVLGGVKIGQGISIDQEGVISAQGGKNDVVLDVAELDNMSYADRKVLWDEVYEKILAGHRIYAKGEVRGEMGYYAYLPLEKYISKADNSPYHTGFLYFAAKDTNANTYLYFVFSSAGNLSGLIHNRLETYDIYSLPKASSNTLGGVKIGSGISIDEDGVISAQGGGAEVVLLNKLTEQERLDLYSAITACYDYGTQSFTSAWTEDKYAFFIDLRDNADQQEYQLNDTFEGFFPMRVARCHPTDYGGAVFFTGVEGSRYGEGEILNIKFVIVHDGSIDKGTWRNRPVNIETTCVYVGPNGEYWLHRPADVLYSEGDIFKISVKGCTETFSEEWGFGSFVYARKRDTGNGWYYQWSLIVPTNTGVMKGVWHCDESNGGSMNDVSTYVLDSWTAV